MNPNTSNKDVYERLKRDPKWRTEAIKWLRRRKRILKTRYKEKYAKGRDNTSKVSANS